MRLPEFDYAQGGAYFVTIVTAGREVLFSDPVAAAIVERHWQWLAERYPYVSLDEFVVMPNHLHGILLLEDAHYGSSDVPRKSLGSLIGAFKTVSTQEVNRLRRSFGVGVKVWQRGYWEHGIRDDNDLNRTRSYIIDNPRRWDEDPENPSATRVPGDGTLAAPFPNGAYGIKR